MASTAQSQLQRLLQERTDNRVLRIFGEHVQRQKNSYCRIDAIHGKEVVIGGHRLRMPQAAISVTTAVARPYHETGSPGLQA